jgi:hypothetical protein
MIVSDDRTGAEGVAAALPAGQNVQPMFLMAQGSHVTHPGRAQRSAR